jgi:hypothetical protein
LKAEIKWAFDRLSTILCVTSLSPKAQRETVELRGEIWGYIEELEAAIKRLREAIASESELPGDMPDEMWEHLRNNRNGIVKAMRLAVRLTKQGILERAAIDAAKGGECGTGFAGKKMQERRQGNGTKKRPEMEVPMPNADLARREKPCPTCGGKGTVIALFQDYYREAPAYHAPTVCPTCHGNTVYAESPEEYAAQLRELVEQARKELDWLADVLGKDDSEGGCPPGKSPAKGCNQDHQQCWLDYAARAVAGKDGV